MTGSRSILNPMADPTPSWLADHQGECPYPCPLCAAATVIRDMNPDVAEHLAAAVREFVAAARAFMESLQTAQDKDGRRPEKIHFDSNDRERD